MWIMGGGGRGCSPILINKILSDRLCQPMVPFSVSRVLAIILERRSEELIGSNYYGAHCLCLDIVSFLG